MSAYLGVAVGAAAAAALATGIAVRLAWRFRLVDAPGADKIHQRETPTLGGLAVVPVFLAFTWAVAGGGDTLAGAPLLGLTLGTVGVLVLGVYDDLRECPASVKLVVQAAAAVLLYASGFRVDQLTNPFGSAVTLGVLAVPATLTWVLVVTNAVNLIDGLDGLAGGVVAIAVLTLALITFRSGETATAVTALLLGAALVGFLPFNWPPARIFLGDTGSLALGYLVAALSLLENRKGTVAITLLLPIVLLGLPLIDALSAVTRRLSSRQHPFRRDTRHLHHRLLDLGLPPREVTLLLWGGSAYFAVSGYLISLLPKEHAVLALLILGLGVALGVKALQYVERAARRRPAGR